MNAAIIRLIRIDGIVPQTKSAIREALEVVPENVMLIRPADANVPSPDEDRIVYLQALNPGDSVNFTDGSGKYYGKITRTLADERTVAGSKPRYVLDGSTK